jgi:hypothetical protein
LRAPATSPRARPALRPEPACGAGRPGATFVTLRRDGELRGCIGTLEPHRALEDVRHTLAAAFDDPRCAAHRGSGRPGRRGVGARARRPFAAASEAERCAPCTRGGRPDPRGRGRRATFLPQVWEQLPAPSDFLTR